ncbi:SipW-dependent-type signal peptide-containing protein [Nocardioides jensenii]|uniref:SipW-dependent-type signal peptide-containing protein n=1 Tax=Nocardioides jensenii TaxID=1843 RepID=UPI000831470D|nr:SipW-dependent-type signal peptide-containing protein [Nocardioides jensenii]
MARHAESTARRIWSGARSDRTRALLSLGLLVGFGSIGTYAYWSDTAVVTGGPITSGAMDLQFDTNGAVGNGAGYAKTTITWTGLAPDERKAFNLTVKNVGNPPFTYLATATRGVSPTWTFTGSPITVQLYAGTAVADTTYPQQDSCTGSPLGTAQAVDTTNKPLISTAQEIAAGGTQSICIIVGLDPAADNANQSKTGSVSLTFTANQKP